VPEPIAPPAATAAPRRKRFYRRFNIIFLLTVALPTLLAGLYYGLVASDVYISESRFVVRSPERGPVGGLDSLLSVTGISPSNDDTYLVVDYILSRDVLRELDQQLKLRDAYGAEDIDFLNRFPGLDRDQSFEALHRHYMGHVSVTYDATSSITSLAIRAYTAEEARNINDLLVQMSERLVNNLNDRSRRDLIAVAQREVAEAEGKARNASLAISSFRTKGTVYDPDRQSALQLETVVRLREELRVAEGQLAQLRRLAPANPQVAVLAERVERLQASITKETSQVLGGTRSLSGQLPAYERLVLDKLFAEKQLESALISLEAARSEAARKQLYLERLVQPNLPDTAVEPRRMRYVFTVFVIGLIAWGIVSLLVAGVREHAD
jgi:capsular polysaccharide transport system permease protein